MLFKGHFPIKRRVSFFREEFYGIILEAYEQEKGADKAPGKGKRGEGKRGSRESVKVQYCENADFKQTLKKCRT